MNRLFTLVASLIATAFALVFAGPAAAIVAMPPPRTCAAFSAADVVVVGKVTSQRVTSYLDTWSVRMEHRFKGNTANRFEFYSENDSARATPDVGQRNILFLHRQRGRLVGWGSDPNAGGRDFDRLVREVRAIMAAKPSPTGSVVGLVASEAGTPRPNARVRLVRFHGDAVRWVRTDRDGRFRLSLPPGRWSAKLTENGWTSRFSLYSYDNPEGFIVKAGGCNDLRLEPVQLTVSLPGS